MSDNQRKYIMTKYNNLSYLQRQILFNASLIIKQRITEYYLSEFPKFTVEIMKEELKEYLYLKMKYLEIFINDRQVSLNWIKDIEVPINKTE